MDDLKTFVSSYWFDTCLEGNSEYMDLLKKDVTHKLMEELLYQLESGEKIVKFGEYRFTSTPVYTSENTKEIRRYMTVSDIVRCADCKHCIREDCGEYTPYGFYNTFSIVFCDKHFNETTGEYLKVNYDDFCSFAERKTDG